MTKPTYEIAAWRNKAISHDCNYGRDCFTYGHGEDYPMVDEAVGIMLRQRERIAELEAEARSLREMFVESERRNWKAGRFLGVNDFALDSIDISALQPYIVKPEPAGIDAAMKRISAEVARLFGVS